MPPKAACKKCKALVDEAEAELSKSQGEVAALGTQRARLQQELNELKSQSDSLRSERDSASAAAAACQKEHADLQDVVKELRQQLAQRDAALDAVKAHEAGAAGAHESELAKVKERLEERESELAGTKAQLDGRDSELLDAKAELDRLRAQQASTQAIGETDLKRTLEETQRSLEEARHGWQAAARKALDSERLQQRLSAAEAEADRLRGEHRGLRRQLERHKPLIEASLASDRMLERAKRDGSMTVRIDFSNPAAMADLHLGQLHREQAEAAERAARDARIRAAKGQFGDSLEAEIALHAQQLYAAQLKDERQRRFAAVSK